MTEAEVLLAVHQVVDPEVGVNIVDLGLVYSTEITDRCVKIVMTMTTPACPLHSYLTEQVREVIQSQIEDVEKVEMALVWDPPWSPQMISETGSRQLGWQKNDGGA